MEVFDSYSGLNGIQNQEMIAQMKDAFAKVYPENPRVIPVTQAFEELQFEARMATKAIQEGSKPKNIFQSPAYKSVE